MNSTGTYIYMYLYMYIYIICDHTRICINYENYNKLIGITFILFDESTQYYSLNNNQYIIFSLDTL